jgi:hypothetical protein
VPDLKRWDNVEVLSYHEFTDDGIDVEVSGDGTDLERYVSKRRDIFNSCDRKTAE